jgi:hypothetical protein
MTNFYDSERDKPIYSRKDVDQLLEQQANRLTVKRVTLRTKDGQHIALIIMSIDYTPEGIMVMVQ